LVLSSLFVDHPFFTVALDELVRLSNTSSLRRSRSAAQLNVGNRLTSKGFTERYEGLWALAVNADHFRNGSESEEFSSSMPFGAPQKADSARSSRHFAFVTEGDIGSATSSRIKELHPLWAPSQ
jgi:hypothetical protein